MNTKPRMRTNGLHSAFWIYIGAICLYFIITSVSTVIALIKEGTLDWWPLLFLVVPCLGLYWTYEYFRKVLR